jgi:hypothetical protein
VGLRPRGRLSVVSVVFCQLEVSTTGRSLVQRSPTECGVSECDREASRMARPWALLAVGPWKQACVLTLLCFLVAASGSLWCV